MKIVSMHVGRPKAMVSSVLKPVMHSAHVLAINTLILVRQASDISAFLNKNNSDTWSILLR
jgi:hypothetical protein